MGSYLHLFQRAYNDCVGSGVIAHLKRPEDSLELGQLEKDGARI